MNTKLIPRALRQCKVGTIFYSLLQNDISSIRISKSVTHFECFSLSTIISVLKHICSQKKKNQNKLTGLKLKTKPSGPTPEGRFPLMSPFCPTQQLIKMFLTKKVFNTMNRDKCSA